MVKIVYIKERSTLLAHELVAIYLKTQGVMMARYLSELQMP